MLTSLSKPREVMVGSRTSLLGRSSYRVLAVRSPIAPATRTGTWSYGDDLDEVFDTGKVAWVARVEPLSTDVSVGCNEHGEVEFCEGDGADCQLALQGWNVRGYLNAGVEYRVQRRFHGSATD